MRAPALRSLDAWSKDASAEILSVKGSEQELKTVGHLTALIRSVGTKPGSVKDLFAPCQSESSSS